jgi:transposase
MKKRKTHSAGFKTKVVLELLQKRETVQEIGRKYDIHPSQISTWKSQFLSNASSIFEKRASKTDDGKEKDALFKKVGQLQLENDFLKKYWGNSQIRTNDKSRQNSQVKGTPLNKDNIK